MRDDLTRYEHVLGFAVEHPWAITPAMRAVIADILARRVAGEEPSADFLVASAEARDTRLMPAAGSDGGHVAVIPIRGVIAPRMNLLSKMSGGTTFEGLTAQLREAVDNAKTKAIVFDVDSPGGNVAGATEFAREVMKARTRMPIVAQANHLMASAAYWPMSGATEIVASPSAMVGSVGVYHLRDDISESLAKLGIKREVIAAGKFKAEGVDGGPLGEDARAHLKQVVSRAYDRFVGDIAKGRGVAVDAVRAGYGEGRTLSADDALAAGLVDRIDTLDDTLARVSGTATAGSPRAAVASSAATTHEPLAATVHEQRTSSTARHEFERRVLELKVRSLHP